MSLCTSGRVKVTIVSSDGSERYEFEACKEQSIETKLTRAVIEAVRRLTGREPSTQDVRAILREILYGSGQDVPDPTWEVDICAGCWMALAIQGIRTDLQNAQLVGKIKDSYGNEHNLQNVTLDIEVNSGSAPTIVGDYCTGATIKFSGQITPQSDICMYEIAFWLSGTLGNASLDWVIVDIRNGSGTGFGVLLKANRTYTITVEEDISCPSTVSVPAPDGTC